GPQPTAVHANELRHGCGLPRHERNLWQRIRGRGGRGARTGADAGAGAEFGWTVCFRCPDSFRSRRFQARGAFGPGSFRNRALEPEAEGRGRVVARPLKFQNYVKEIYYDSDTSLALLSGAPFDDPSWWLLSNEQIVKAREIINDFAGSRRLLAHSVITPKQPGWMEEVDKAIAVYKPDSWKSYTIGDPLAPSTFPWRLDDEQVMYPFYEKAVNASITTTWAADAGGPRA